MKKTIVPLSHYIIFKELDIAGVKQPYELATKIWQSICDYKYRKNKK